jgi:hypothetical protein
MRSFARFCAKLIRKGNMNSFEISKNDESWITLPVTVLVLLLIVAFWITIPLLIVGLFFGFRYRFTGPDLGENPVNGAMDSAAHMADDLKSSIHDEK